MEAKYFVGSDSEYPVKIYFTWNDAAASGHQYIDSFDEHGNHLQAYKKEDEYNNYTRDF